MLFIHRQPPATASAHAESGQGENVPAARRRRHRHRFRFLLWQTSTMNRRRGSRKEYGRYGLRVLFFYKKGKLFIVLIIY